jgi:hypothetical protein
LSEPERCVLFQNTARWGRGNFKRRRKIIRDDKKRKHTFRIGIDSHIFACWQIVRARLGTSASGLAMLPIVASHPVEHFFELFFNEEKIQPWVLVM